MSQGFQHTTQDLAGARGLRLFSQTWDAPNPRALLVLVHGALEHSDRYRNLLSALAGRGISVVALNLRGHGRSQGARGHVDRFDDYVADLAVLIEKTRTDRPGLGLFLLGHSLGGVIAARYAVEHQDALGGLVLSSPAFVSSVRVAAYKELVGRICSRVWPTLTFATGLNARTLSHDPEAVALYLTDPMVLRKVSARFYAEITAAGERCLAEAHRLVVPLLALHGTGDRVVESAATQRFVESVLSADKTLLLFPTLYHETMNESLADRNAVLGRIVDWLAVRAGR